MRSIDRRELLVLAVAFICLIAIPVTALGETNLAVGSLHETDSDFGAGTVENMTVEGSGSTAYLQFKSSANDNVSRPADNASFSPTTKQGIEISIAEDVDRVNATISSNSNNYSTGYLQTTDGTVVDSVDISSLSSGDTVTFEPSGGVDAGTYEVLMDNDGSSYTYGFYSEPSFPYSSDIVEITGSIGNGVAAYSDVEVDRDGSRSAKYTSDKHSVEGAVEGFSDANFTNAEATFIWQGWDGSQWVDVAETTTSTDGEVGADISSGEYSEWRVVVDVTANDTAVSGDFELYEEGIRFENTAPDVDNASASPSGGETVSETPVELSINASDNDFSTLQGDNVTVTFYDASDDTTIGSQTLSANWTASTSWDTGLGEHQWYAVAEDEYGGTTTSDTFIFNTPHELEIRDEENPSELINDTTTNVTVTFFGSDEVFERTTSTGVVDLSGLPDEQLIVSVDAEGYVTRQVVIDSITEQQTAYLLNETSDSVDIRFRLEDPTGQFTESNSQLFVERPIQRNGTTTYRTIAGDEIGQGGYPVTLANDQRYRLILRNNKGDERTLTGFMTQTSETVTLEVESVEYQFGTGDQPYKWTASYENETSEIDVAYTDEDDLTTSLTVRIIEQQNETTIYENVWNDPSEVSTTVAVDGNETSTWLVQLEVERDGETFELETVVGKSQFPVVGDLDEDWQHRIAVALVFVLAGLFGVANASVGALVASLSTGILWVIGWMPPSVGAPMIFVGMTIASLFYVQDSGGGIQ